MKRRAHYRKKFANGYWTLLMIAFCIAVIAVSWWYLAQ